YGALDPGDGDARRVARQRQALHVDGRAGHLDLDGRATVERQNAHDAVVLAERDVRRLERDGGDARRRDDGRLLLLQGLRIPHLDAVLADDDELRAEEADAAAH